MRERLISSWTIGFLVSALVSIFLIGSFSRVLADSSYSGTVSGSFSNPVLTGVTINTDGSLAFRDNTSDAITTGIGTNSISWGNSGAGGTGAPSTLVFTGFSYSNVASEEVFDLGSFTFFNGTSSLNTVIFGVDLSVSAGAGIDPAFSSIDIFTTQNRVNDPIFNADFVTLSQFPSVTFNIFEGVAATAILSGKIVGDPFLVITGIRLAPGQSDNGFISQIPEPSTLVLLGLGLLALGFYNRHSRTLVTLRTIGQFRAFIFVVIHTVLLSSVSSFAQVDPAKVLVGRWEGQVELPRNPERVLIINRQRTGDGLRRADLPPRPAKDRR